MSATTITLLFLLFAIIMFVWDENSVGAYINDRLCGTGGHGCA